MRRRPSPGLVIAILALIVALGGQAGAGPLATKPGPVATESAVGKKKVKKLAAQQVRKLAPELSVAHAQTAGSATTAGSAATAGSATTAVNAQNATTLAGVAFDDLVPITHGVDEVCPQDAFNLLHCTGPTLLLRRKADVLVMVTGTWFSPQPAGAQGALCDIRRDGTTLIGSRYAFGSTDHDTDDEELGFERAIVIVARDTNRPPGSYNYSMRCDVGGGTEEFTATNVRTTAISLGS